MNKSVDEILCDMHAALCTELLKKIQSGEAVASDYEVARKLLKDHKIIDIPMQGKPIMKLSDAMHGELPEFDEESLVA